MKSTTRTYLTTLTPLRGIAAVMVVIFHSNLMLMPFIPIDKPHLITAGWLWVDFFFVLSGFIMSYVYGDYFKNSIKPASYWKYLKARFARVYPLHLVTMIWCLICALIIIRYADGFAPFFQDMFNPMSAIPSLFLAQSLNLYITAPLNTPSWSLSTEWWMYMIFPLLVPYFFRIKWLGKIVTLIVIGSLFAFVKYYLGPVNIPFPGGSPSLNVVSDFGIFRCMAGFLLGMFVFTFYHESIGATIFRQSWAFILFFFGLITAMHLGVEDIIVVIFFPLVILSAAHNATAIKRILEFSFLQRLGDWSFSIYMVHVPIIYVFWIYQTINDPTKWAQFPPATVGAPDYELGMRLCLAIITLTLLLAYFTYRYVEVPARSYFNKGSKTKEFDAIKVVN